MGQNDVFNLISKLKPKEEITAKEIAKRLKISVSSVQVNCVRLRIQNLIGFRKEKKSKGCLALCVFKKNLKDFEIKK